MKNKPSKPLHFSSIIAIATALGICTTPCFADHPQVLDQLVYQIRNPDTDPENFRNSLEKIGEYLALDVLEELNKKEVQVTTLTGATATHHLCDEDPVLITILRAGIPLYLGVQKIFPNAKVGFLGTSRNEETLQATTEYVAIPEIKDQCVVIIDTMIATGGSILDAIQQIEKYGPRKIIVVGAIAAEAGIARILQHNPDIHIYTAVTDPALNEKGYIIPGLGDAGDRAYGCKKNMHTEN